MNPYSDYWFENHQCSICDFSTGEDKSVTSTHTLLVKHYKEKHPTVNVTTACYKACHFIKRSKQEHKVIDNNVVPYFNREHNCLYDNCTWSTREAEGFSKHYDLRLHYENEHHVRLEGFCSDKCMFLDQEIPIALDFAGDV